MYVFGSGEWIRGFGFGFTNHVGEGAVLDVCLCLCCGGVGGVGGDWLAGLDKGMGCGIKSV